MPSEIYLNAKLEMNIITPEFGAREIDIDYVYIIEDFKSFERCKYRRLAAIEEILYKIRLSLEKFTDKKFLQVTATKLEER